MNEKEYNEELNKIVYYNREINIIAKKLGIGDVSSYSKLKEVSIASLLEHKVCSEFSGPDGIESNGDPAEYKSTIGDLIKATYSGISKQETWELQLEYLNKEKIGKYPNHYIARFDDIGDIIECYKLTSKDVLTCLIPKLKRAFFNPNKLKDPRLAASLSMTEIKKYGVRVYGA